jgi:hygromycin-B 7''-O-kinase
VTPLRWPRHLFLAAASENSQPRGMAEARVYSERLGALSDAQFETVAARWNLGRFISAEPTTSGLFGQNLFLTTTEGAFVLRGAPHWVKGSGDAEWRREDRWQFTKEVSFARQLHERTRTPVPWPMVHDQSSDIFGWPYIVMPRMPGICFEERGILKALERDDRRAVAIALGAMLAEMQTLHGPFAGDFDPVTIALVPYPHGDLRHVAEDTTAMVAMAERNGVMTLEDRAWIDAAAMRALAVSSEDRVNAYVHGDYKLNNLTVAKDAGGWRVSGLFDLHESRFGDGAIDVARQACSYLDTEPALARAFVDAYRSRVPADPAIAERLPLYILNDRLKFWVFFTRPGARAAWSQGKTFRDWAGRYMDEILKLL